MSLVFSNRALGITDGIDKMGSMRWELFGVLILAWVLVYLIIWKGINQSGYVIINYPFIIFCLFDKKTSHFHSNSDHMVHCFVSIRNPICTAGTCCHLRRSCRWFTLLHHSGLEPSFNFRTVD